jgi:hypothetical protein
MSASHPRRGASNPTLLIGVVVGAIVLLGVGYLVGRGAQPVAKTDPVAVNQTTPAPAAPPAVAPTTTPPRDPSARPAAVADPPRTPAAPGSIRANPNPPQWAVEAARRDAEREAAKAEEEAKGPPPFEFDPPRVDFGYVAIGEDMEQDIKIRNITSEPLKILAMRPDCKCTTVQDLANTVIPPNSEIEFTAVVDGRDSAGGKTSEIRFVFEGYGPASLQLKSVVTRAVRVDPGYIVALEGVQNGTLQVGTIDRKPFRILAMNGGPVSYADDFDPDTDDPRYLYKVHWDFREYAAAPDCTNARGERVPYWVVFETDHPDAPVVDVRVRHDCTRVVPPSLGRLWVLSKLRAVIDEVDPGQSAEFDVDMKWLKGAKPNDTIRAVRSNAPEQFTATLVKTTREEDRITLRVRITPVPGYRGLINGEMTFYGYNVGHEAKLTVLGRVSDGEQRTQR